MTVVLTETVVLPDAEGNDHGVTAVNAFTIATIANIVKRIVPIPTTETGLLGFATDLLTAPGTAFATYVAGHFDEDNVRYIRITNVDDTNHVTLLFRNTAANEFAVLLDAGQTFIFPCDNAGGTKLTMDADAVPLGPLLADLADITAIADTASVDLEVFVASI